MKRMARVSKPQAQCTQYFKHNAFQRTACRAGSGALGMMSAQHQIRNGNQMQQHFFRNQINIQQQRNYFEITHQETIGLNDEQLEYQRLAKEFAEKYMPNWQVAEWDRNKTFPAEVLREGANLGFGGIYVSPDYGGTGLSRLDASIIVEQLAKYDVSTTAYLTIHNMCAWMVDQYGNDEQRERILPALTSMESFSSYCLTEPGSGSDAAALKTKAIPSDPNDPDNSDYFYITGEKAFISGGGESDYYLVMTKVNGHNDKITCFILEKGMEGLSFGKNEKKLGWNTQPTRATIMDNVKVPRRNMLGNIGDGFKIAMQGLDGGRINIGTCSVGGAQQCLNYAQDYMKVRSQFGKTLSQFQYLQFKLAEMATTIEASRLMVRQAATQLDLVKNQDTTVMCSMAKKFSTENCYNVTNDAIQMFGGYGYLNDYPCERYMRDLRVHSILEGTNEIMNLIISRYYLKS